jgi:hypothetical protein
MQHQGKESENEKNIYNASIIETERELTKKKKAPRHICFHF